MRMEFPLNEDKQSVSSFRPQLGLGWAFFLRLPSHKDAGILTSGPT